MSILFERLALPRDMLIMPSRSLILPKIMTTSGSNCFIEFIMFLAIMLCAILVYSMANIKKRFKGSSSSSNVDNNNSNSTTIIETSVEAIPESDISTTELLPVPLVPAIVQTPPKPKRDTKPQLQQLQTPPKQTKQSNSKTSKKKQQNRAQKKNFYNTKIFSKKYKDDERPLTVPPEVYSDVKIKRSSFYSANRGEDSDKENRNKSETYNKREKMSDEVKNGKCKKEKRVDLIYNVNPVQYIPNGSRAGKHQVTLREMGFIIPRITNNLTFLLCDDLPRIMRAAKSYLLNNDEIVKFGFPFQSQYNPGQAIFIHMYPLKCADTSVLESLFPSCMHNSLLRYMIYENYFYYNYSQRNEIVCYDSNDTCITYTEKKCARCRSQFYQSDNNGEYYDNSDCVHHWGKPQSSDEGELYSCCQQSSHTMGCESSPHVWNGAWFGYNGPIKGYVKTFRRPITTFIEERIYSVDCEMVYTNFGMQVAQVTVVDEKKNVVYNTLVKPEHPVIDYNTRFSGITKEMLSAPKVTKTLTNVQNDLLTFIFNDTILVGHGLENDLRVLKIIHGRIIDTSILFLENRETQNRLSLRKLAQIYLNKTIQDDSRGHDSIEDARACMDLVLMKIRSEY